MLAGGRAEPTQGYCISEYAELEKKRKHTPLSLGHGYFSPNAGRYDKFPSTLHSEYVEEQVQCPVEVWLCIQVIELARLTRY